MRTASRPEAVAVCREGRIDEGLQDLQQGLLDQAIRHRRNTQLAHAASGFRDLHAANRTGPVTAVQQAFPYPGPVRFQVLRGVGNRPSIHPSTTAVGPDALPRESLRKQVVSPRASGCMPRRPCFIAHRFRLGFTSPPHDAPRLRGLLMHCTSERHSLRPSHSFGPSPRIGSYYGLC